jgi:hypothetical protein
VGSVVKPIPSAIDSLSRAIELRSAAHDGPCGGTRSRGGLSGGAEEQGAAPSAHPSAMAQSSSSTGDGQCDGAKALGVVVDPNGRVALELSTPPC